MADRYTITFEVEDLVNKYFSKIFTKRGLELINSHNGPGEYIRNEQLLDFVCQEYEESHGPGRTRSKSDSKGKYCKICYPGSSRPHGPGCPPNMRRNFSFDSFSPYQVLFYEMILKPELRKRKLKDIECTCGGEQEVNDHIGPGSRMKKRCQVMFRSYENPVRVQNMLRYLAAKRKIVTWENDG